MSNLSGQIFQAVDILVNKKIEGLKFDKTVEGIITSIQNIAIGEYRVKYNGNIFSVFSNDLKKTYKPGDKVFIKIPEGDFSKRKFIETYSSGGGGKDNLTPSEKEEFENVLIPIEPSFDELYGYQINLPEGVGLIAGNEPNAQPVEGSDYINVYKCPENTTGIFYDLISLDETSYKPNKYYTKVDGQYTLCADEQFNSAYEYYNKNYAHLSFSKYAKSYPFIILSADFQTKFQYDFISGNYGLEVRFFNTANPVDENSDIVYNLDINSFNGNPYRFSSWNNQKVVVQVSEKNVGGLKSIKFFEKDFPHYDCPLVNGVPDREHFEKTNPNIFVQNINIQFVEKVDVSQNLYHLQVQSPEGFLFYEDQGKTSLTLEGTLYHKSEKIMTKENSICQWYKRDSSVTVGTTFYEKSVGPGWRKVITKPDPILLDSIKELEDRYKEILAFVPKTEEEEIKKRNDLGFALKQIKEQMNNLISYYTELDLILDTLLKDQINALQSLIETMDGTDEKFVDFNNKSKAIAALLKDPETVDFNKITVSSNLVKAEREYQLGVIYNQDISLYKKASLYQYDSIMNVYIKKKFSLKPDGTQSYDLYLTDDLKNTDYLGNWYISLPGTSYEKVTDGIQVNKINIDKYMIYSHMTFVCDVYKDSNFLCTREIKVSNTDTEIPDGGETPTPPPGEAVSSVSVSFMGDLVFKYDANGDVTPEEAAIQKALWCELTEDRPYQIEWFMEKYPGSTVPQLTPIKIGENEKTMIPNSMLENLWVDTEKKLHYNISQRYKFGSNNVVIAKITTTDDQKVYTFKHEVLFLKDGDSGTNGTSYILRIVPCDSKGQEIFSYKPFRYDPTSGTFTNEKLFFTANIYKEGTLISESEADIIYEWQKPLPRLLENRTKEDFITLYNNESIYNFKDSTQKKLKVIGVEGKRIPDLTEMNNIFENHYFVSLRVELHVDSDSGRETIVLYDFYPIDTIVGDLNETSTDKFLIDLPKSVLYDPAGERPLYSRKLLTCELGNKESTFIAMNNFVKVENKIIRPISKYLGDSSLDTVGLLKCKFNENACIIHPIILYLNTYGNEAINGWDGKRLKIDEENGQYILAPQIGAGVKNDDNTFTGFVMGRDPNSGVGLYGYGKGPNNKKGGTRTFELNTKGEAIFGPPGQGQIIISGEEGKSTISSANFNENNLGMKIDLDDGILIMKGGIDPIKGTIKLDSSKDSRLPFLIKGDNLDSTNYFAVDWNGELWSEGAHITGEINANSGHIGSWHIIANRLQNESGTVFLDADTSNNILMQAGNYFRVYNNGLTELAYAELIGGKFYAIDNVGKKMDGDYMELTGGTFSIYDNFLEKVKISVDNDPDAPGVEGSVFPTLVLGAGYANDPGSAACVRKKYHEIFIGTEDEKVGMYLPIKGGLIRLKNLQFPTVAVWGE